MDGVLIDARDWHYDALNKALNHFGVNISLESHLTTFDGLPTKSKLTMLSDAGLLPQGLHDLIHSLKQKYTIQYTHNLCKPNFEHQRALSALSAKYKIGLCSNSIKNTIKSMMNLSDLESYLDVVVSSEDVECPKPSPEMYLLAMKILSVKPHECLIVEDNENGVKAALDSGAHLLRVSNPVDVTLETIEAKIQQLY